METYEAPEIFELGSVEQHTFGASGLYCEAGDNCCDQNTDGIEILDF
ncbi:MAG: hypothetical protein AAGM22_03025 [Acidobacteriota bacterium]